MGLVVGDDGHVDGGGDGEEREKEEEREGSQKIKPLIFRNVSIESP